MAAAVRKRTFSISAQQSDFVDDKVRSGGYASSSEVVRDALRTLEERDAMVSDWLRREVVPSLLELKENPGRAGDVDEVFDDIEAELDARARKRKRA